MLKVFSKKKNGNEKLTEHFKVKEFACKDGTDVIFIETDLAEVLEKIRNHFNKAVHITSGYRTVAHNIKCGGAIFSQHCYGMAVDIYITGVPPKEIALYAQTLLPDTGGIGLYPSFVHIDVRETKSRWNK